MTSGRRIPGLQSALDFYRLACTPQYENDGQTPLAAGYQANMMEWRSHKLTELRSRMPKAGGLVIAPNIKMAEYFVKLIEQIEGERPILVHSQLGIFSYKNGCVRRSSAATPNKKRSTLVMINRITAGSACAPKASTAKGRCRQCWTGP